VRTPPPTLAIPDTTEPDSGQHGPDSGIHRSRVAHDRSTAGDIAPTDQHQHDHPQNPGDASSLCFPR
jgi:hypothetical protein